MPKSSSSTSLDNPRKQTEKVATECILYGYRSKDSEWKVIDKYERISQGQICEDYPRRDPNASGPYSFPLSGDVVIRNLTADASRKAKRYDGGYHWIKITFDSAPAADRACFFSPQEIEGHLVFCGLYEGHGPAEDSPIPADSGAASRTRNKAPRTLTTAHSTAFLSNAAKKSDFDQDRTTLPRSFAMKNLSSIADVEGEEEQSIASSTATITNTSSTISGQPAPTDGEPTPTKPKLVGAGGAATGVDSNSSTLRQRQSQTETQPESEYMTHIPTVRRTKLRPLTEALPPQPTVTERVLRSIPILSWFTGDIVGDGPQLKEDGTFDYDNSNVYWRFWYMLDKILGTDICGLHEES